MTEARITSGFIGWWTGELASLIRSRGRGRRPWRLMALRTDSGFELLTRSGQAVERIGALSDGGGIDARLRKRIERGRYEPDQVVLRLSPQEVIAADVVLPSGVRDVIGQVLRNQLERYAPWPADHALFAYEVASAEPDPKRIAVKLWVAGKAQVGDLLARLAEAGIRPGVVDSGRAAEDVSRCNFIASADDGHMPVAKRVRAVLACGMLLTIFGSAAGFAYMLRQSHALAAVESRIAETRSIIAGQLQPGEADALRHRELAIARRSEAASASIMIEMLSRALPDDAVLDRLDFRQGVLTLSGKAQNAAALIGILEATGHFADVQFAAPTVREGLSRDSFSISARPVARMEAKP